MDDCCFDCLPYFSFWFLTCVHVGVRCCGVLHWGAGGFVVCCPWFTVGLCLYRHFGDGSAVVETRAPSILLVCANKAVKVVRGPRANTLRGFGFSRLLGRIPRLGEFGCHVSSCRFGPPVSSSSVRPTC